MIKDGDRHHRAESARFEHGVDRARHANDDIVVEFVLHDDVNKFGSGLARG
jgi:hypothetical protein